MKSNTTAATADTPRKRPAPITETDAGQSNTVQGFDSRNHAKRKPQDEVLPLPHALGVEKAVLSVMFQYPEVADDYPRLCADHFHMPAHRIIFERIKSIRADGREPELVSFIQGLISTGRLDEVGGTAAITDIYGYQPSPSYFAEHIEILREHRLRRQMIAQGDLLKRAAYESGDAVELSEAIRDAGKLDTEAAGKTDSRIVEGVLSFPTEIPAELVLLGNAWMRPGDIGTFISSAGNGKSVAMTQAPMAWGLGLPYLGIRPSRPLRVLHFTGEDDEVTIGQCREGFLEHSEVITGRQLSAADLAPLDSMLRTEFSREHVGPRFHSHLARLLREHPADLVVINPLLSYIGGEIVACASEWLRAGLMPILQQFDCAALIASHTPKLSKDGWDNTDDTYSAIGGGEMANIPRTILTLRPTAADGLSVLKVSKRQTTGWKDTEGNFTTSYFVRRTNDPTRPAWLPVDSDEAQELLDATKGNGGSAKGNRKVTVEHVTDALESGDMQRQALIDWLMRECICSDRPARDAITEATNQGLVRSYTEANPRGGKPLRWFALNREEIQ
jgi:hypothetical protein